MLDWLNCLPLRVQNKSPALRLPMKATNSFATSSGVSNLTLPVVGFEIIVNFASPCLFVDDDSGAVVENFLGYPTPRQFGDHLRHRG